MVKQGDNRTHLEAAAAGKVQRNNQVVANPPAGVENGKIPFVRIKGRIDLLAAAVMGSTKQAHISVETLKKIQGVASRLIRAYHQKNIPEKLVKKAGPYLVPVSILAVILMVSISLGLVAAFGIPFLANPKPLPVTGANPGKTGLISVVSVNGVAQVTYPGKKVENLVNGMVLNAVPNMQVSTAQGNAKIQLADDTVVYVDDATVVSLVSIANPKRQVKNTVLQLNTGGILVENARSVSGVFARVKTPGAGEVTASGPFLGAAYLPSQARLDVDCLGGPCQISGPGARRDLVAGQHAWMIRGELGGVDTARWSIWANLCDADCPLLALNGPVPQTTPTYAPTPLALVPDPSAVISEGSPTPVPARVVSGGANDGSQPQPVAP